MTHRTRVADHRLPGQYEARCDCGWAGRARGDTARAYRDAARHGRTANSDLELVADPGATEDEPATRPPILQGY